MKKTIPALCVRTTRLLPVFLWLLTANSNYAGSATWLASPATDDWNTAANWTPATVPNGSGDTATFGISGKTGISLSANIEVDGLVFAPGASAYVITSTLAEPLTISGSGIINNSGIIQTFFLDQQEETPSGNALTFSNTATAGNDTVFSVIGGEDFLYGSGGKISFLDNSSADHGTFDIFSAARDAFSGGYISFSGNSSAAEGSFILHPNDGDISELVFTSTSTAGQATITNEGGIISFTNSATGGSSSIANNRFIIFHDTSSVDQATVTNNAGSFSAPPFVGTLSIWASANAGKSTIINQGAAASGLTGGSTSFGSGSPSAGNAILIAESGANGGSGGLVKLESASNGGTARVEIFGNGQLDISGHDVPGVTIGSLEGDGIVILGVNSLTIGSANRNTAFAGLIQGTGAVTKVGKGILTLSGANSFTGGMTLSQGTLVVTNTFGSATGAGPVRVNGGTLAGTGIIAGSLTLGTGNGTGVKLFTGLPRIAGTLTAQSRVTFNADSSLVFLFDSRQVSNGILSAKGVTINPGALFAPKDKRNATLPIGTTFTVISNISLQAISGSFSNLADGSTIAVDNNTFQANYEGGSGNDLILTVVP